MNKAASPVANDDHYAIGNIDYHTTFNLVNATRKHSGIYTITATNVNGTDTADVEITILGKPSKPKGPLKVSDVHKEGCTLKWDKPEDDGGSPIEYYEIEKMDEETGRWVPAGKSTEPRCEIANLQPGHKYKFRVRAVNKEGDSEELETDQAIVAKNEFDEPGKPGRPEPTDWDKDHVDLKWTPPANDGGTPITGYIIEKKKKGTHKWLKGAQIKGDVCTGTCPNLEEGEEYEFRVIPINKEGPGEPSDPSRSVVAKPRKLAPLIDRNALKDVVLRVGQPVKFDVGVQGEPTPTIVWTFKDKELKTENNVTIDTIPNSTTIMLAKTKRAQSGTYKITATNIHGKDEATVEIKIVGKPSKPKGPLEVTGVHGEGCKLKWDKPEDDGGEPIQNYVIEKMDVESGRWVPVTTSKEPEAEVTGLVPGKKYKFRVKAVNPEGESEPLETDKDTLAKDPYDPPGNAFKHTAHLNPQLTNTQICSAHSTTVKVGDRIWLKARRRPHLEGARDRRRLADHALRDRKEGEVGHQVAEGGRVGRRRVQGSRVRPHRRMRLPVPRPGREQGRHERAECRAVQRPAGRARMSEDGRHRARLHLVGVVATSPRRWQPGHGVRDRGQGERRRRRLQAVVHDDRRQAAGDREGPDGRRCDGVPRARDQLGRSWLAE